MHPEGGHWTVEHSDDFYCSSDGSRTVDNAEPMQALAALDPEDEDGAFCDLPDGIRYERLAGSWGFLPPHRHLSLAGPGQPSQLHDKRQDLKNKAAKREVARAIKDAGR